MILFNELIYAVLLNFVKKGNINGIVEIFAISMCLRSSPFFGKS